MRLPLLLHCSSPKSVVAGVYNLNQPSTDECNTLTKQVVVEWIIKHVMSRSRQEDWFPVLK